MTDAENYAHINNLNERTLWLRGLTGIAAVVTCVWIIYHAFKTDGILATLVGLVFLTLIYRMGVAPLFAVVATLLCFYFHSVGWWLPAISYVLASFLLYMDLRLDSARRKMKRNFTPNSPSSQFDQL